MELLDPKGLLQQKTMSIQTPIGSNVRFAFPENGDDLDVHLANKLLILGNEYTVADVIIHNWRTDVELVEVRAFVFNSTQFENVE